MIFFKDSIHLFYNFNTKKNSKCLVCLAGEILYQELELELDVTQGLN